MELGLPNTLLAGDQRLIDHIVGEVKSQGIFDQFRKECIADVDTKPAYQNLRTRVEGSVNSFLNKQLWKPDLNKNQLRETLRKHIHDAPYLDAGVERIVDQVVNPKVYSVFMSQIEDVVYKFLGIERPKTKEKNGACGLKDLLPKDLDPVSPESDKNSLKDVSLESLDTSDNFDGKQDDKEQNEQIIQVEETCGDRNKTASESEHIFSEEKSSEEACKSFDKTDSNLNLNTSEKSDDKVDEEEEDSPMFEPIDIMNLNESNISNDSHLSGISELTSHRSRSPDFSNELSRDNFDCSNQDSQLSKVSSDSRLSIITDLGSSNHDSIPLHDTLKEEATKNKYETKNIKYNFKAIRELDSYKNKVIKNNFEINKGKETQDYKEIKDSKSNKIISSKENSRDAIDSNIKDKCEHKSLKEKNKDSDSSKLRSIKEKISTKDTKYKDGSNDKKRLSSHSSIKYDKYNKYKDKDKIDQPKETPGKVKDTSENVKDNKFKEEKLKETDKKDNINKEAKDLKDLYKEKIRELREKKELTEKEKLNKDKDIKLNREVKDKKDSSKDRKSSKKEHKSSSSSSSSSSSRNLTINNHGSKTKIIEKTLDENDKKSDSKDKIRRDEKRLLKDSKSKSHCSSKTDLSEKLDKSDLKKIPKTEKEEKTGKMNIKKEIKASSEKTNDKKDVKDYLQHKNSDRNEKLHGRKNSKSDNSKDKKRRDDKKSKTKDDHSSLRKNSSDRRSSDRDGSNGSNGKSAQPSNSNSNITSSKSSSSSLVKENQVSNSSSETSDSIEEMQMNESKLSHQSNNYKLSHKSSSQSLTSDKKHSKTETNNIIEAQEETDIQEISLPLKKRLLSNEHNESDDSKAKIKKPKFAKNIHEAKKLMKIRKQMEKRQIKEDKKTEKNVIQEAEQVIQLDTIKNFHNLENMPDDERVQIIEVPDEEYEEPYPEKQPNLTLDERSIIMLGAEGTSNMSEEEKIQNLKAEEKIMQSNDLYQSSTSSTSHVAENSQVRRKSKTNSKNHSKNVCENTSIEIKTYTHNSKMEEVCVSQTKENIKCITFHEGENMKQLTEKRNNKQQDNNEIKSQNNRQSETYLPQKVDAVDLKNEYMGNRSSSFINEDNEDCRYLNTDNEELEKFSNFLESRELIQSSLEDMIESLGGKIVSSMTKSMAPPWPKRKSSPLSDILVNNSDNNNDDNKQVLPSVNEDSVHNIKKRKLVANKKQRFPALYNQQGILNGENFVMPLSPESDVSATSEKTSSSNIMKEEKSRNRSNQRYSSDDLYKPRPLFSSSSRRSRRFNQA